MDGTSRFFLSGLAVILAIAAGKFVHLELDALLSVALAATAVLLGLGLMRAIKGLVAVFMAVWAVVFALAALPLSGDVGVQLACWLGFALVGATLLLPACYSKKPPGDVS